MSPAVRIAGAFALAAALIWVGVGMYRAGGEVPPRAIDTFTKLLRGHAEGRRVDGNRSWSLDYDKITASQDTTIATLENVHNGELYRHGRPFLAMKAHHVVVNTVTNDFTVTGPVEFFENDGKHKRRFTSDFALYSGFDQTLTLAHRANILSDGARVNVASAVINFKSGDMTLGRIVGLY